MKSRSRVVIMLLLAAGALILAMGCLNRHTATPPTGMTTPTGGKMPIVAPPGTKPSAVTQATEKKYTYVCPVHADQRSDKPGKCPKCGAFMKADTTDPVEYYCPTHPDVVQSEPGECAKCGGMALAARPAGGPVALPAPKPASTEPVKPKPAGTAPAKPKPATSGVKTGA